MSADVKPSKKRDRHHEWDTSDTKHLKREASPFNAPPLKQLKISASGKVAVAQPVEKDPLEILKNAKDFCTKDKQNTRFCLRDFTLEHLPRLTEEVRQECAKLLVDVVTGTRYVENGESALRALHALLTGAEDKRRMWTAIYPRILGESDDNQSIRGKIDGSILSLLELAIQQKLFDYQQADKAVEIAERNIHADDHAKRCAALNFLISFILSQNFEPIRMGNLERDLRTMCLDRDPRVRTVAVSGLAQMCEGERCLSLESYKSVTEVQWPITMAYDVAPLQLCSNSEKNVRLVALRLVQKFAERYPEAQVTSAKGFKLRLHDDAFSVVCHSINDLEMGVRAEAASLLGRFETVSDNFLHQTLDKKLMRQLKVLKDGTVAKRTDDWSTGKKLGEDVPMEKDEEGQSMIPNGRVWCLRHGTRRRIHGQAAVYSLGKLAANRPAFANASIDHLADMFNDEIQQVRLDAIRALTPLVTHGTLQQEQLHTILTCLDDATADSRLALHELLSKSNLADAACIRQCLKSLLHSLHRFPSDKQSIFRCLSLLGRRHAMFIPSLVTELLNIHPLFHTPEQNIDDDYYLARLILILNGASRQPVICSLLPAYITRHYRYLRCSMPNLIAVIKEMTETKTSHASLEGQDTPATDYKVDSLLNSTYERIVQAHGNRKGVDRAADLQALQNIEEEIAIPARFLHCFCEVMNLFGMSMSALFSAVEPDTALQMIQECFEKISWIERQYGNVNRRLLAFLSECTFRLSVLEAGIRLDMDQNYVRMLSSTLHDNVEAMQRRLTELEMPPSQATTSIVAWLTENIDLVDAPSGSARNGAANASAAAETKKELIGGRRLMIALSESTLEPPAKLPELKKITMKSVLDPSKDAQSETTVRFVAGLPTGVKLNCMLYNLSEADLSKLRVRVEYPDETVVFFRPRSSDVVTLSDTLARLSSTVLVSASLWAEAAEVQLTCGVLFSGRPASSRTSAHHTAAGQFVPLPDADNPSKVNKISVKIFPMQRA
ncbi:integrator complex subunit 4 [Aphelenchoides avenae]|nr:integrator complex subunit 4 [Aphelenchus avenae]